MCILCGYKERSSDEMSECVFRAFHFFCCNFFLFLCLLFVFIRSGCFLYNLCQSICFSVQSVCSFYFLFTLLVSTYTHARACLRNSYSKYCKLLKIMRSNCFAITKDFLVLLFAPKFFYRSTLLKNVKIFRILDNQFSN